MQTYNSRCKYEGGGHNLEKTSLPDLVCLSHLRWSCAGQGPLHLLNRWSRERRVFFIEEPLFPLPCASRPSSPKDATSRLLLKPQRDLLLVVTPCLRPGISDDESVVTQRRLLDKLMANYRIEDYLIWYYTKTVPAFTRHLRPRGLIYDCVDDTGSFVMSQIEPEISTRTASLVDDEEPRMSLG